MMRLFLILFLACPLQASSDSSHSFISPLEELMASTQPRKLHVRRGRSDQNSQTILVTPENVQWRRRRRSLQNYEFSSDIERRLEGGEEDRDEGDPEDGADVTHRTWGQASGNQQGGYQASGYHNGYTKGSYNASIYNQENAGPTGDHTYLGCLGLSNYELEHEWKFSGEAPKCSYVHHARKRKRSKDADQANALASNATCEKSGWFSSCSQKKGNNTSWSTFYKNHFSGSSKSANTTNSTANEATSQYSNGDVDEAPDQEEGEGNEDQEEEMEENGSEDEEEEDDQGDDDTVLTNENYENVNGDDFVYNQSSVTSAVKGTSSKWWSKWGQKNQTLTNATNVTSDGSDVVQADAAEVDEAEDEPEEEGQEEADEYDPYDDFDLEQCDSYENLWLWDLSLTCKNTKSLDACECSYAEELLFEGTISCEDFSRCPSDCAVCRTCFQLMGCVKSYHDTSSTSPGGFAGMLVGAGVFVVVGGIGYCCMMRRKRDGSSELGAHLMWREVESKGESDTDSNDSGAWAPPKTILAGTADNLPLFDDYYKSMDEGEASQPQMRPAQHRKAAIPGRSAIQLTDRGETDTIEDVATTSVADVENSSTDNSDDCSEVSDYDSTVDGSTVLSADETGAQKIWLAPVDVKLDQ
ncbi:hypothetical protein MPSEU_000175600 [Mayamaea pseudoterrestris]|nr:hypothetical protein MPSEU_000175600 [Mayamaea pseudoterrestris]